MDIALAIDAMDFVSARGLGLEIARIAGLTGENINAPRDPADSGSPTCP
ncbi:MAG: hypothetical protein OXI81_15865 [Paracoccaceae bacterium]|nr:hypothetical protein [Paracoccaceae bacterium]